MLRRLQSRGFLQLPNLTKLIDAFPCIDLPRMEYMSCLNVTAPSIFCFFVSDQYTTSRLS
jgi:hypothetical protein